MSFVNPSTIASASTLDQGQADTLPHGAVKMDDDGNVIVYNRWETEIGGIPTAAAIGKNFFSQIAPCTNNRLVLGRFKSGVDSGVMDHEFNYTFTYKMKPTNVVLRLYRGPGTGNWLFVGKK